MVDQPQILERQELRGRGRVDAQAREGKHAGAAPLVDGRLDFRRPHQVGLVGRASPVLGNGDIIVRAADLVLGAVAAFVMSVVLWLFASVRSGDAYH